MNTKIKMSEHFKLPVCGLIKKIDAKETFQINCDGVTEFEAIEVAINAYDANQAKIKRLEAENQKLISIINNS